MRRKIGILVLLSLMCILVASCMPTNRGPDYLFQCSNQFYENKAFFTLNGNKLSRIKESKFNGMAYTSNSQYMQAFHKEYLFIAKSYDMDPAKWQITQTNTDVEYYDPAILVNELREMKLEHTGGVNISVYTFDAYKIVEVEFINSSNTPIDYNCGVFKDGKKVASSKDAAIRIIRGVFKRR